MRRTFDIPEATRDAIARMPKTELHLHLDGTIEPEMKLALAQRNGIDIGQATVEEVVATFTFNNLPTFIAAYNSAQIVLRTSQDFEDLAYAYLRTSAEQNVRHAEMFFDPQLHTGRGIPFGNIVGGYRRAILRANAEFGITAELIMCFVRDYTAEFAMATLMEALPYREWIIGIGLDSLEKNNPPDKFREVYDRARREGFLLTFHSDLEQEDQLEHLRQGVIELGANRVDHGLHVLDSEELMTLASERRIGFTATPLGYAIFTATMKMPEIRALLEAGVPVSVGADDPAFFGGYLSEVLEACVEVGGMGLPDLVQLQRNAIETAWVSERRRDELRNELEAFAATLG